MDAAERFEDGLGLTVYRVPVDSAEDFLAWGQEAAAVFREYALSWSLWRNRADPQEWIEFGPRFRERAALERAAAALETAGVLDRLAAFELDPWDEREGPVTSVVHELSTDDYDAVLEVGGSPAAWFDRELPPIDAAQMTAPMRLAHSLARALASRLNAVVPAPFRVAAEQERVYLFDDRGMRTGGSIVDLEIEDA